MGHECLRVAEGRCCPVEGSVLSNPVKRLLDHFHVSVQPDIKSHLAAEQSACWEPMTAGSECELAAVKLRCFAAWQDFSIPDSDSACTVLLECLGYVQ